MLLLRNERARALAGIVDNVTSYAACGGGRPRVSLTSRPNAETRRRQHGRGMRGVLWRLKREVGEHKEPAAAETKAKELVSLACSGGGRHGARSRDRKAELPKTRGTARGYVRHISERAGRSDDPTGRRGRAAGRRRAEVRCGRCKASESAKLAASLRGRHRPQVTATALGVSSGRTVSISRRRGGNREAWPANARLDRPRSVRARRAVSALRIDPRVRRPLWPPSEGRVARARATRARRRT